MMVEEHYIPLPSIKFQSNWRTFDSTFSMKVPRIKIASLVLNAKSLDQAKIPKSGGRQHLRFKAADKNLIQRKIAKKTINAQIIAKNFF